MPRPPLLISLLAIAFALAPMVGASGGAIEGRGTASSLWIDGVGPSHSTGQRQWTLACTDCFVRLSLTSLDGVAFQDAALTPQGPGNYEIRDYAGAIVETVNGPFDVSITFLGWGEMSRIP